MSISAAIDVVEQYDKACSSGTSDDRELIRCARNDALVDTCVLNDYNSFTTGTLLGLCMCSALLMLASVFDWTRLVLYIAMSVMILSSYVAIRFFRGALKSKADVSKIVLELMQKE